MQIIAADVGGTNTRLVSASINEPRTVLHEIRYLSGEFDSFEPLLQTFIKDSGLASDQLDTLSLALPGLVGESSAKLTNLPWTIDKKSLMEKFGIDNVYLMNDFQASALGTRQLLDKDRVVLNEGMHDNGATCVAVGAGTGLGVAWIQYDKEGEQTYSTEGGHIDFAPQDDTQSRLLQFLQQRHEHVSYERVLSGSGLVSLYEFFTGNQQPGITAEWVNNQTRDNDEAANKALSLFVQVYGAYVGNLALLYKPYGGIFITGGIAPKIVKKMQSEDFISAYLNKGRMREQVKQIPVYLVTNEHVGVLGAMSEAIKMKQELK